MAGRIAYYGNIVRDGLVLLLDAAKKDSYPGSGTLWRDISGNGNNGTLTNGPTFNSGNGGSIVFDGVNDYVVNTPYTTGNIPLTISMWSSVITQLSGDKVTIIYGQDGSSLSCIGFYYRSTDLYLRVTNWNGVLWDYSTGFLKDTNVWHNDVLVYQNNTVLAYRDGVADPLGSKSRTLNFSLNRLLIGTALASSNYSNVKISYVSFYNRALTAAEVLQNYNATKNRYI